MSYPNLSKTSEHKMPQTTASSAERRHHSKPPSLALDILALQHTVGNHAVNHLLQRGQYSPALVNTVPSIVHEVLSSSGQPLDAQTGAFMESGFDHDFSQVRVHTDEHAAKSAEEVHALAYTVGEDIVFGAGQYAPDRASGRQLLAHELAHVLQQEDATTIAPMTERGDSTERAAQVAAQAAVEQGRAPMLRPTGLSIARDEPETMSTKRVRYDPGEREGSKTSAGGVNRQGEYTFTLFNFEVNEANLKPDHEMFLDLLVGSFKLRQEYPAEQSPQQEQEYPRASIRLVQGYTDLVDTETVNAPLRHRRAEAVVQFLVTRLGVAATNIDVVRGAPAGTLLADNTTPEGRARNRAVEIQLEKVSEAPERQKLEPEQQRSRSNKWALGSITTAAAGEILGGGGGLFVLKNRLTGEERQIAFAGLGLAGGASVSKGMEKIRKYMPPRLTASLSSPVEFDTVRLYTFEDFEGPGFIDMLSGDIIVLGYQLGYAHFARIETTTHKGIWIGGKQAGGFGLTGAILFGRWFFT